METPITLTLSLTSDEISDNQRERLTRELEDALRRAEGVDGVERPSHPIEPALEPLTKSGDPITIGQILMVVAPAAITGVLTFIGGWMARKDAPITLELESADGSRRKITVPRGVTAEEINTLGDALLGIGKTDKPDDARWKHLEQSSDGEVINDVESKQICPPNL